MVIQKEDNTVVERLQKELFVLALSHNGYTQKEIGEIMGIGESRVQQIKRKALVRVKQMYKRYCDEK